MLADVDNWSWSGHGPFDFLVLDGYDTTHRNENGHGWVIEPDDYDE